MKLLLLKYIDQIDNKILFLERGAIFFLILFIPFCFLPINLPIIGQKLPYLFCLIGYLLWCGELIKKSQPCPYYERYCIIFFFLFILWNIISSINGAINFEFYHLIDLNQLNNFKNTYLNLSLNNEILLLQCFFSYSSIRDSFLDSFFTVGISVFIIHVYKYNYRQAIKDIRNAITLLTCLLILYSCIEIGSLCGNELCKSFLTTLNPIYMNIAFSNGWWPPLFYQGQVRSLFAEPSFFGIYAAFSIPFFISKFFSFNIEKKILFFYAFLYMCMVAMTIMTKARTATGLFIGELILYIFCFFYFDRKKWKRFFIFMIMTTGAFFMAMTGISHFSTSSDEILQNNRMTISTYMNENVTSVIGNHRSNNARFANVRATFQVGLKHPLLGVGYGLTNGYVNQNLNSDDLQNFEVRHWREDMMEKGILKSGFPQLNQLAAVFASKGLGGLLLFFFPIYIIIWKIFIISNKNLKDEEISGVMIAFFGLIGAFFSNIAGIEFYIVVGILFCVLINNEKEVQHCEIQHD